MAIRALIEREIEAGSEIKMNQLLLQLRAKDRRMYQQYGIKLFVIDYLQLLHSTARRAEKRGKSGNAKTAYKKALDLDPTNGLAYYGLGVVADAAGDYEDAIEYYRRALLIDPSLADPKVNPQVVNNARILVVKLLLSKDRAGAMSLPLQPPGE